LLSAVPERTYFTRTRTCTKIRYRFVLHLKSVIRYLPLAPVHIYIVKCKQKHLLICQISAKIQSLKSLAEIYWKEHFSGWHLTGSITSMTSGAEKFRTSNTLSFVVGLCVGKVTTVELTNDCFVTGRVTQVKSCLNWINRLDWSFLTGRWFYEHASSRRSTHWCIKNKDGALRFLRAL